MNFSDSLKSNLQNLLLLLASTLFSLLCVEIGFRIMSYINDQKTLDNLEKYAVVPKVGEEVTMGQIIKLSLNDNIIYEFIPNLSVSFLNQPVDINAHGFRGTLYPKEKNEGTKRVVGIGDSQMFGWGVKSEETYLSVLSDSLNRYYTNCVWEVINTAVPGYNTVMELEILKEKGLSYQPDYVIVGFIGNDFSLPNFIKEQEDYFSLSKSFIFAYFNKNLKPVSIAHTPLAPGKRIYPSEPEQVPKKYKHLVGDEAVKVAMEDLKKLSQDHNFEVLILIGNRDHKLNPKARFMKENSDRLGFHFLELHTLWEKYVDQNDIPNPDDTRFLSENDKHASALAHEAMGQGLFHFIRDELNNEGEENCK